VPGRQRTEFRYGDLEIAQNFQQEGFKFGIGAVNLIDQQ